MKLTRQGVRDLNDKPTNGRYRPPRPLPGVVLDWDELCRHQWYPRTNVLGVVWCYECTNCPRVRYP